MTGVFSSFFGLRDNPFRVNPDPRYLFLTQQTQDSLAQLIEGIRARKGLMVLTGEVGTGKTVLLNRLMEWLDSERIPKAFIFNSHLKVSDLFDMILKDFGVPFVAQRGTPLAAFTNWLEDRYRAGETAVLIVDEAQGLAVNVIEELCMLLNLEAPQGNLLQIVLCGQPEFDGMLQRLELRQIRQRVAVRCRTLPLTPEEIRGYIANRLRIAEASDSGTAIFHPEALQALYMYSGGIARILNLLCEQALMRASREKLRPVPGRIIGEVAHEFQLDRARPLAPLFGVEGANVLELFAPRPVVDETLGRFAASAVLRNDGLIEAHSPEILSSACANQPAAPAAAGESMARVSKPPIKFPAQVRPQPPAALGLKEMVALSILGCPMDAARVPQTQFALGKRWKIHFLSMANIAKCGIAAMSLQAGILLVRLETRMLLSLRAAARRLALWRNINRHVRIAFGWPDFARSWRQWLRATKRRTEHKLATTVAHPSVPHPAPAAHGLAASQISRRRLRSSATRVLPGRNLENTRRFTTSVLHWLQQPSRTLSSEPSAHSSSKRIA